VIDDLAQRRRAKGQESCWACHIWLPVPQMFRAQDTMTDDIFYLCRKCSLDAAASGRSVPA